MRDDRKPPVQKWEYCLVLAHLEGSSVEKTVVLEKAQTTSTRGVPPRTETSDFVDGDRLGLNPEPAVARLRVLAINGQRPKEGHRSMYALANELGEQGWGLVNVEHTIAGGSRIVSVWVFKRSKPASRL